MVFEGSREELTHKLVGRGKVVIETVPEDHDKALACLQRTSIAAQVDNDDNIITVVLTEEADVSDLPTYLIQNDIRLVRVQPDELSLEQAFMDLTKGKLA